MLLCSPMKADLGEVQICISSPTFPLFCSHLVFFFPAMANCTHPYLLAKLILFLFTFCAWQLFMQSHSQSPVLFFIAMNIYQDEESDLRKGDSGEHANQLCVQSRRSGREACPSFWELHSTLLSLSQIFLCSLLARSVKPPCAGTLLRSEMEGHHSDLLPLLLFPS